MQGDIGVAESTDGGISWRHLGIALDEEWHLSFPYVFDYDGQVNFRRHIMFMLYVCFIDRIMNAMVLLLM